ncbi:alpha/beta hydrolase [Clostridia bacterium]|nr:alpha/beta hydrolase [Clostridia bacterium]
MSWYEIVILMIAIFVGLYALICLLAANLFIKAIITPSGKSRRTFEEVRERDRHFENVDFNLYDSVQKEEFMLPAEGGVELSCVLIRADQAPWFESGIRPKRETCVIVSHGFAENKQNSIKYGYDFLSLGIHVLLYDHRAFGESTGKYCSLGIIEHKDLSLVITEAKRRLGEHVAIGIHGESMGAMAGMMALTGDDRIEFLVEDCGPTYLADFTKKAYRAMTHLPIGWAMPMMNTIANRKYHFTMEAVRPADGVAGSDVPLLFIHGSEDQLVPSWMCPELYSLSRNPHSKMALFEGAAHARSHSSNPVRYKKEIVSFLTEIEVL